MKSAKWSVSCTAFLGMSLLLSATASAEYGSSLGSYNSSFSSDLPKASSTINPVGSALGGKSDVADQEARIKASLEKSEKILERSAKESELRKKVAGANTKIEKLQTSVLSLNALQDSKLKEQQDANAAAQKFIGSLNQAQNVDPNALNTSQMEKTCRSGVDLNQTKQFAEQLGSEPFRFLRDQGTALLEEKDQKAKEAKAASITKLFDTIEKFQAANKESEAQQSILQRQDLSKGDNSLDSGLKNLEAVWNKQKQQDVPAAEAEFKKTAKDTILNLSKLNANQNDKEFTQLKNFFADNAQNYLKTFMQSATQGANQLLANCEGNVDSLGRGNPLGGRSWTNSAYQFAAKMNPRFANDTLLPMLNQITQNATCTDVSPNLQQLFGAQLQRAIELTRTSRDPKALIQNAFGTMQAIAGAQAQLGQTFQPLMDDCQYAAKQLKKMQDYVGQVQQQQSAAADEAANAQAGPANRNRQTANRSNSVAAHNPQSQQRRRQ